MSNPYEQIIEALKELPAIAEAVKQIPILVESVERLQADVHVIREQTAINAELRPVVEHLKQQMTGLSRRSG